MVYLVHPSSGVYAVFLKLNTNRIKETLNANSIEARINLCGEAIAAALTIDNVAIASLKQASGCEAPSSPCSAGIATSSTQRRVARAAVPHSIRRGLLRWLDSLRPSGQVSFSTF